MADLSVQTIVNAGTAPTFGVTSVADTAPVGNGHDTFVVYKNASAGIIIVTIDVPGTTDYGALLPNPAISVPVGGEVWIPLRKEFRAIDGSGRAALAPATAPGTLTVAVVRLG